MGKFRVRFSWYEEYIGDTVVEAETKEEAEAKLKERYECCELDLSDCGEYQGSCEFQVKHGDTDELDPETPTEY